MPHNSEVQDHLGDVFARQGRVDDAIAAWNRALEGDASDVDLTEIRRKINDARSKTKR
jgi:predicted negative regulator of RcsB-dependent stress response